jgi:hypothetical protein
MRAFGPSLLAFLAGVVWLGISSALIPASEGERVLSVATSTTLDEPCSTASMIARLDDVNEASGLALSRRRPDLLWTHNDSGQPVIYAFGTDGKPRGRVRVVGAGLEDWEDIASGPCPGGECLYIADIGDNKEERPEITIYRVPEPTQGDETTRPADVFHATYPDGPHDAEAFFVGPNGAMYVVTKGEDSPIAIYRFAANTPGATARLERVATLADSEVTRGQRVTDAEASPDGKWVALRTLDAVLIHPAEALLTGDIEKRITIEVRKIGEPQGEGVAILADGTIYLAGEAGDGTRGGTLARVSCKLP